MKKLIIICLVHVLSFSTGHCFLEGDYQGTANIISLKLGLRTVDSYFNITKTGENTYKLDSYAEFKCPLGITLTGGRMITFSVRPGQKKIENNLGLKSHLYGKAIVEFSGKESVSGQGTCMGSICDYSIDYANGKKMEESIALDMEVGTLVLIGKMLNKDGTTVARWAVRAKIVD